jgi:hypothetical protein
MELILLIVLAVVGFVVWNIFAFVRYKGQETGHKRILSGYLASGFTLSQALERVLTELNGTLTKKLNATTVSTVAEKLASLQSMMDTENVIEIYSTFVYRYIGRNSNQPHPNVNDTNVLYALNNMEFQQQNGYFVLKPDRDEDIDKKYPHQAP